MSDLATKIFSRNGLIKNGIINNNTIFIPEIFLEKSLAITNGLNERCGWLIAKKYFRGDFIAYVVEYFFISDEGGLGSVFPTKKLNLPNEFSAIEFHVHPSGLGSLWYNQFSQGDYSTFANRMKDNISYKHVLFTPENILTFGLEEPDMRSLLERNYWRN